MNIVFLVSGNGGTLKFVHQAISVIGLNATITAVLSDRVCGATDYAKQNDIPLNIIKSWNDKTNEVISIIKGYNPGIVVTNIHKILHPSILTCCKAQFINLHYSLLPAFGGVIGFKTLEMAKDANTRIIGATCHYVTGKVDGGKVIAQSAIPVNWNDNYDLIGNRIFQIACETILNGIMIVSNIEIGSSSPNGVLYSPQLLYDNSVFTDSFWNMIKTI